MPDVLLQAGITLVGSSSLLSGEGSSTHPVSPQKMLLGMGLIIASQVLLNSTAIVGYCMYVAQLNKQCLNIESIHNMPSNSAADC